LAEEGSARGARVKVIDLAKELGVTSKEFDRGRFDGMGHKAMGGP